VQKQAPLLCTASHGATLGEAVCCGQEGFVSKLGHICPESHPTCVGLIAHDVWGSCQVAEPWQQCGGQKDDAPWWGPTTCVEGYECRKWSNAYSQCSQVGGGGVRIIMKDALFNIPLLINHKWQSGVSLALAGVVAVSVTAALARVMKPRRWCLGTETCSNDAARALNTVDEVGFKAGVLPTRPSATSLLAAADVLV